MRIIIFQLFKVLGFSFHKHYERHMVKYCVLQCNRRCPFCLSGYIGDTGFLRETVTVAKELKQQNPNIKYGKGLHRYLEFIIIDRLSVVACWLHSRYIDNITELYRDTVMLIQPSESWITYLVWIGFTFDPEHLLNHY